MQNSLQSVVLMIGSTLCYSGLHALIRSTSQELHPFELAFFRNLFGLLVIAPWFFSKGLGILRTTRLPLHLVRAGLNALAVLSFFYAFSVVPLAEATALSFVAPIFATVLAVIFLGEVVGGRRWLAILMGIAGVFVLLRPGFETVSLGEISVLIYSLLTAIAIIVSKSLSRTDSSVTIIAYVILLMIPISAIPAISVWQTPTFNQLILMVLMGILGTSGQLLLTEALRRSATYIVMPLDFLKMVWAVIFGVIFFGEYLSFAGWLGSGLIILGATYIVLREGKTRGAPL